MDPQRGPTCPSPRCSDPESTVGHGCPPFHADSYNFLQILGESKVDIESVIPNEEVVFLGIFTRLLPLLASG